MLLRSIALAFSALYCAAAPAQERALPQKDLRSGSSYMGADLRACNSGVRAELPAYNSPDLLDLSLFLAWRGEGLAVETPGVRR